MTEADAEEIPLPGARSNRPVTLAHRVEFSLAVALSCFFRIIGVDAASAIAGGFTRTVGPLIGPITARARTNLAIAYPDWPRIKTDLIIREVWENLGRTTAEFAHLSKFQPDPGNPRMEVVGRDRIEEIAAGDRPVIFVSGHFANWEVGSIVLHALGVDYGVIYRAANNPLIDGLIIKERARVMSRRQIPKGKRGGRDMIESLRAGASLAMLVDQKLNSGGIPSPFFGKEAMTAPAAARLSIKYHAPIIPIEIERVKGAHFRVTAHEAISFEPSGDANADTQALTDLVNLEIEELIRRRPGQWLWLHRRWPKETYR
jgi:KDO2-lipid IV(A) lauroyltransferase